ncbi:MAG: periplasmic heavy metal sensor [Calditrichaeota bacterium]|nr:MAG: hypothetical protein DWQ03_04075 [Calditrichota bacterium]MBL1204334.1 periplasmic heavy metal sensor [Calditrichota bacterium]NOG44163.1 periplasmic heavy metal sensor [Calditrichota bacterium]
MKASKIYLSMILAVLVLSASLVAQNPNRMKQRGEAREGRSFRKEKMMNLPGLTDEQKEKMKEIKISGMKAMKPIRNQLGEKLAKLQTLETAEKPNMSAINETIDEISSLKTAQAKLRAGNKQRIRALLNDEQKLFFDAKGHGKGGKHGRGMGKRGQCMQQ